MNDATLKRIPKFVLSPENGFFSISGRSYPENVIEVYQPILEALDEYALNPKPRTTLDLKFDFCSTSTSKILISIFEKLEDMMENQRTEVLVNWYCEELDEDKFELGEDLKESTDLPFVIVMIAD